MGICPMKKKSAVELKISPLIQQPVKRDINRKYHIKTNQVLGMGQFGKVILATNAYD